METGDRTAGDRDEHKAPDRCARRMHAAEIVPDFRDLVAVHRKTDGYADSHDDQADTENRINLSDNLIDGNECRNEVINQNDCKPHGSLRERSGHAFLRQKLDKKSGRADSKDGTDHDQKDNGEDTHNSLHRRSKIRTGDLRDRCTSVSLGKHTGKVVMDSAGKNCTECDPQEYDRSPQCALHRSEDRAEACDIQQLDQEQFPLRHDDVVNTVVDRDRRSLTVIRSEGAVYKLAIGKVSADKNSQTDNKA